MLVIRLFRTGKKNQPFFKIVLTDKRKPTRAGRFVEELGSWNPLTKDKVLRQDRIKHWLSVGAKPSATVHNLLVSEKVIEAKKIPVHKTSKENKHLTGQEPKKEKETVTEAPKPEEKKETGPVQEKPAEAESVAQEQTEEKPVEEKSQKEGLKQEKNPEKELPKETEKEVEKKE